MNSFALDPRLAADTSFVMDLRLSRVLLMNDARFPWLILVPMRAGLIELHDVAQQEMPVLMAEIANASRALKSLTGAAKINVAALGNLVPQLHLHVVARNSDDPAWPGSVWGQGAAIRYSAEALAALLKRMRAALIV